MRQASRQASDGTRQRRTNNKKKKQKKKRKKKKKKNISRGCWKLVALQGLLTETEPTQGHSAKSSS